MAHPGLELSAMGAVRPPADAVLAAAQRREQQGFDAIWWADHLLHWFPLSIWTPDLVPQAAAARRAPTSGSTRCRWWPPRRAPRARSGSASG